MVEGQQVPVPDGIDGSSFGWAGIAAAVVAVAASVATLVLGARDLWNLQGPGWAKVLAYFAVFLVVGSLTMVFVLQRRHNRFFQWLKQDNERQISEAKRAYDAASAEAQTQAERRQSELREEHERRLADLRSEYDQRQAELELRYRRQAGADLVLPSIHQAQHHLRDATYSLVTQEPRSASERLAASLAEMAAAFSIITGSACRASIKLLNLASDAPPEIDPLRNPEFLYVTTLCRHDHTNPRATRGPDPLMGNTDFMQVWDVETPGTCFFSNDLDQLDPYENSHRTGKPRSSWAYNSAMVWPIQKAGIPSGDGDDDLGFDMLGFFCVDSLARNQFRFDNDFHLGAGYADALYTYLSIRNFFTDTGNLVSLEGTHQAEEKLR